MCALGQKLDIVLVLCHSFFYHAFSVQRPVDEEKFKLWLSSRFIANLIIEKQAELPPPPSFAVTSQKVFDKFAFDFHGDKPSFRQKQTVDILRNSIFVVNNPSINALSLDDSVLVICDALYSSSNYETILISNIPKKVQKAEEFYRKKVASATVPYPIYDTIGAEAFLRGRLPELCKTVDDRMKNSVYRF